MYRDCRCGEQIYLEGETGTPENFYHGECPACGRRLTIRQNVKNGRETEYWTPATHITPQNEENT